MTTINCELGISVAATDNGFLLQTVPHLIRSCGDAVQWRTLIMDTAPITGVYTKERAVGRLAELRDLCADLKRQGWVDEVVEVAYDPATTTAFNRRTFGRRLLATHDMRGYPIYGLGFRFDSTRSRHYLHFDSDMFIHQTPGHSWIQEGMALLRECPEVLAVLPLSGPPHPAGLIAQPGEVFLRDPRGFFRFPTFTSRIFLLDVQRYEALLPMKPLFLSRRDWLPSWFHGRGKLLAWESALTAHMRARGNSFRADLASPNAWHVHPTDKGARYLELLPRLIAAVERGEFPPEQASHFDLKLDVWAQWLAAADK
jgi:hypothetical protein